MPVKLNGHSKYWINDIESSVQKNPNKTCVTEMIKLS